MIGDGFRKGYREGWLAAIHRMLHLVEEQKVSFREAYERCYRHRKRLHDWTMMKNSGQSGLAPPEFEE